MHRVARIRCLWEHRGSRVCWLDGFCVLCVHFDFVQVDVLRSTRQRIFLMLKGIFGQYQDFKVCFSVVSVCRYLLIW